MVQEAVFNALKYAGVSSVDVFVQEVGRLLMAEVIDHGQGFDPNSQPQGTGLGLYGMNERAELVNGKVNVETHLGKGTVSYTHLTLPTTLHECRSRWSPYH